LITSESCCGAAELLSDPPQEYTAIESKINEMEETGNFMQEGLMKPNVLIFG